MMSAQPCSPLKGEHETPVGVLDLGNGHAFLQVPVNVQAPRRAGGDHRRRLAGSPSGARGWLDLDVKQARVADRCFIAGGMVTHYGAYVHVSAGREHCDSPRDLGECHSHIARQRVAGATLRAWPEMIVLFIKVSSRLLGLARALVGARAASALERDVLLAAGGSCNRLVLLLAAACAVGAAQELD